MLVLVFKLERKKKNLIGRLVRFWQLNLFHLIIGGYIIDAGVARSLLKSMSKDGSEDGQHGQKDVPATR